VSYLVNNPERAVFASYLIRFRPKQFTDEKYVYYYLKSPDYWTAIGASKVGIAVPNVNASKLSQVSIPLAPLNEQQLIVAEIEKQFSRLDEAVASLKRVKSNLKRYKAAVLKAAVEGKLTEEWRKHNPDVEPASELLKRILAERKKKWEADHPGKKYKEPAPPDTSNLPELPKGWVWATLPQLGELNRGKSKHRPRNAPHLYGGHYPFVQTGDIKSATDVIREYEQTYSEEGFKQSRLWPKGTLCITIAANIADTAILGFDACFPDSIVGFISGSENVETRFVEYFFRTAKENIERFAPATAQKNINLEILNNVAIPLPPIREQQAIINEIEQRLSVTEEVETAGEINILRAERLRQSILKKAFSGKLI
jgi:type I restriction enzyme S subunit